jgi:undecaprenyl-diphosphatase
MNDESAHCTAMSVALAVGIAVASVTALIASSGEVARWEASIFHAFNDLPDWLERPMWLFQLAGLLFVPLVVAAVAAYFRKWWLVPLKLIVEKSVVKQLVERERPGTTICGYPDDFDETCGNFRDVPLEGLSFVSGHAIIAWGVAALLWPVLPGRWRWLPIAIATLNAIARVYLGAHNPLDVVGGAAIGIALGAIISLAVEAAGGSDERSAPRETAQSRQS